MAGNESSKHHRPRAAVTPEDYREAPAHLSEGSRLLWEKIVDQHEIDAAAFPILVSYFEARDRREIARLELEKSGAVIKDRFGVAKISPWASVERDSTLIMHRAFRLLGFDQEARGGQGSLW